jgi:alcohol dehydrogenase class IV
MRRKTKGTFNFQITTVLIFGTGGINNLATEPAKFGHKALIVTYPNMERIGLLDKVVKDLKEKNIEVITFNKMQCNP